MGLELQASAIGLSIGQWNRQTIEVLRQDSPRCEDVYFCGTEGAAVWVLALVLDSRRIVESLLLSKAGDDAPARLSA